VAGGREEERKFQKTTNGTFSMNGFRADWVMFFLSRFFFQMPFTIIYFDMTNPSSIRQIESQFFLFFHQTPPDDGNIPSTVESVENKKNGWNRMKF